MRAKEAKKSILVIALLLLCACGKNNHPTPAPRPTQSPIATQPPQPKPSPYPVPLVDLAPYLHEQGGQTVEVDTSGSDDAGSVINKADGFSGSGKLIIKGGGKIKTQVVLKHDSEWSGEYFCETQTLEGCVLVRDNTKHEGKGATVYEPTYTEQYPAITVFQTYASAKDNYASAENVTVKGFKILGRQTRTDGGVRQAISFGNCKNCAAIENDLSGIASIGIQFGGGAAKGNHAENSLAYRNKLRHFAAAAIALVNVKGAIAAENDIADPGRRAGEPGGISAIDIESNNTDDCVKDIKIFNNRIGYGRGVGSGSGYGNGILGQNVYGTPCSGGLLIANNVIDGYEGASDTTWVLSNGLYFVGDWQGGLVVNNVIIRALQTGASFYSTKGLTLKDNQLISCGGGGNYAVMLRGSAINNSFINNLLTDDPNIGGSVGSAIWADASSHNNVFDRSGVVFLTDEQGSIVKCTGVDGLVGGRGC